MKKALVVLCLCLLGAVGAQAIEPLGTAADPVYTATPPGVPASVSDTNLTNLNGGAITGPKTDIAGNAVFSTRDTDVRKLAEESELYGMETSMRTMVNGEQDSAPYQGFEIR